LKRNRTISCGILISRIHFSAFVQNEAGSRRVESAKTRRY